MTDVNGHGDTQAHRDDIGIILEVMLRGLLASAPPGVGPKVLLMAARRMGYLMSRSMGGSIESVSSVRRLLVDEFQAGVRDVPLIAPSVLQDTSALVKQ